MTLEERRASSLKKRTEEMAKILREASLLSTDIESLESEMRLSGVEQDMVQIQEQLCNLQVETQRLQKEIDLLGAEMKTRQADLHARENRFRNIKEQIMKIQIQQSELIRLVEIKDELETSLLSLNREIAELDVEIGRLGGEMEKCQDERRESNLIYESRVQSLKKSFERQEKAHRDFLIIDEEVKK